MVVTANEVPCWRVDVLAQSYMDISQTSRQPATSPNFPTTFTTMAPPRESTATDANNSNTTSGLDADVADILELRRREACDAYRQRVNAMSRSELNTIFKKVLMELQRKEALNDYTKAEVEVEEVMEEALGQRFPKETIIEELDNRMASLRKQVENWQADGWLEASKHLGEIETEMADLEKGVEECKGYLRNKKEG